MRAANSTPHEAQTTGEVEAEEQDEEEEEEEAGQEVDAGIRVEEAEEAHHNLIPVVVASATPSDFFQFTNEQQWIT